MLDFLHDIYAGAESVYYALLDWLQERFNVYGKVVNPLEKHGVPTFPIFLLFVLLLALFIASLVPGLATTSFALSVQNAAGEPLDGVAVSVFDGSALLASSVSANGTAFFQLLPSRKLSFIVGNANRSFDLAHRSSGIISVQ